MLRTSIAFFVGIVVGLIVSQLIDQDSPESSNAASYRAEGSPADTKELQKAEPQAAETLKSTEDRPPHLPEPRIATDNLGQEGVGPEIPAAYRYVLGPPRQFLSSGAEYLIFENEPIDSAWAYGMETGINSYLASLGPESGAVFEFVQCRSTACVIAGYVLEGYDNHSAMVVGKMREEPWWNGGGSSSSVGGQVGGRDGFVIFLSRGNSFVWDQ